MLFNARVVRLSLPVGAKQMLCPSAAEEGGDALSASFDRIAASADMLSFLNLYFFSHEEPCLVGVTEILSGESLRMDVFWWRSGMVD